LIAIVATGEFLISGSPPVLNALAGICGFQLAPVPSARTVARELAEFSAFPEILDTFSKWSSETAGFPSECAASFVTVFTTEAVFSTRLSGVLPPVPSDEITLGRNGLELPGAFGILAIADSSPLKPLKIKGSFGIFEINISPDSGGHNPALFCALFCSCKLAWLETLDETTGTGAPYAGKRLRCNKTANLVVSTPGDLGAIRFRPHKGFPGTLFALNRFFKPISLTATYLVKEIVALAERVAENSAMIFAACLCFSCNRMLSTMASSSGASILAASAAGILPTILASLTALF